MIVAISLFVVLLLFLIGPRERVHGLIPHVELADDIDLYIRQQESSIESLVPGTEKCVIWNDSHARQQTEYAIVFLHGFSASRQEMSPVCENLARDLGANLFFARLSGHGGDAELMRTISGTALLHDAVEALEIGKRLGKKVIVMGNSTGATLATWVAQHDYQHAIHCLILTSPNFGPKNRATELMLLPWGKYILRLIQGKSYSFEPANEQQQRFWNTCFPSEALLPMMSIIDMVRKSSLEQITQPTLIMYSEQDQVLDVKKMKKAMARIGSGQKQIIEMTPTSYKKHVLAGDILSPETTDSVTSEIKKFIEIVEDRN